MSSFSMLEYLQYQGGKILHDLYGRVDAKILYDSCLVLLLLLTMFPDGKHI